ncbi:phage terminase large subunit [Rhodococcoides fascians]|uniref:PBSX family phage terminase large subunit n=1 Tax=Rhodococcoides fascians TaxID=1828 RepID=UPI002ACE6613|nr:phage terminase large subunit [Rhodococcus fascians]WQH26540.1 phage terminase large subunit [Rhodococcus fascians]
MIGTFSPKQAHSIGSATAKICIWNGAVSAGKTVASLFRLLTAISEAPTTGEIVIIGRTRDTVNRNIMTLLQDPALFGELSEQVRYNRGAPTAEILERTVHILGSSDVRAEATIRGMTISIAYLDEATLVSKEFFAMLHTRLRVKGFNCQLFVTTNPDSPRHWLKTEYIDRAKELGHRVYHFTIDDNAHNLEPGYIADLKRQYSGLWYQRFIEGKWTMAEGVIYSMFDPARHVTTEQPHAVVKELAVGVDYGARDNTRGVKAVLGDDNRIWITREWVPAEGTEAERSASLRKFCDEHGWPDYFFVDPAARGFRLQMHQDELRPVIKANNSHADGIGIVASLLAAGRLVIHESCTELITEIQSYAWDPKAAEKGIDEPVKLDDHAVDALRYAILTSRPMWQPFIPDIGTRLPDQTFDTEEVAA